MDALAMYSKVTQQNQDILVKEHAALVKQIAYHLLGRLPQTVMLEDLIQAGMIGLLDAARNYDASKGASFETYANIRIRGQMLDEVRHNDWVPRSVCRNARKVAEAVNKVENRLGREATDSEIAEEMGLRLEEYYSILKDTMGTQLFAFDEVCYESDGLRASDEELIDETQTKVSHDESMQRLASVIEHLPEREKLILSLYYEQDLNLKEIGKVIGVSESRISQLISQAVVRIQSRLME